MVRDFTFNEVYYLLLAARWTVLLALIAFGGGGLARDGHRRAPGQPEPRAQLGWRRATSSSSRARRS